MAVTASKIEFVKRYWDEAVIAGKRFGLNPVALLAQAAQESDWGNAPAVRTRRNFFGIIATKQTNPFWDGEKNQSTVSKLWFRVYKTEANSFLDFARLISSKYAAAAAASYDTTAYAKAIAASPYIHEGNGDDRQLYYHNVAQFGAEIAAIVANAQSQQLSWVVSFTKPPKTL